ncbi:MAG TPA: hypothetical protein ACYCC3_00400 [Candidatus Azoamicus sp.]
MITFTSILMSSEASFLIKKAIGKLRCELIDNNLAPHLEDIELYMVIASYYCFYFKFYYRKKTNFLCIKMNVPWTTTMDIYNVSGTNRTVLFVYNRLVRALYKVDPKKKLSKDILLKARAKDTNEIYGFGEYFFI